MAKLYKIVVTSVADGGHIQTYDNVQPPYPEPAAVKADIEKNYPKARWVKGININYVEIPSGNNQETNDNGRAAEIARLEALIPDSEKTDLGDRKVPVTAVNPQSSTNPKSTFKRGLAELAYEINQGETSIEKLLSRSSTRGWDEGDINLLVKYNLIKDTRTGSNNSSARTWKPGTVGRGMSGDEVTALQTNLIAGGFLAPQKNGKTSADGNFGTDTETAVKALQKKLGFTGDAVDGAYGKDTKKAVEANPAIFKSAREKAIDALEAKFPQGQQISTGKPPKLIPLTTVADWDTVEPKRTYARMLAIWAYSINQDLKTVDEFAKSWGESSLELLIKNNLIDPAKDTRQKKSNTSSNGNTLQMIIDPAEIARLNGNKTQADQINRFRELIDKASTGAPIQENRDPAIYFLHKIKLLEGILHEGITPAEVLELEDLAQKLGQQGAENNPELVKLINVYNGLKANGTIAANTIKAPAPPADGAAASATTVAANGAAATQSSSEEDRRAESQKFADEREAAAAQKSAMALIRSRVVSRYEVPPGKTVIGKEDGVFYYGDSNNRDAGSTDTSTGRAISMAMYKQGTNFVDQPLKDAIAKWPQIKIVQYVKPAGLGFWKGMQAAPTGSASIKGWVADGNGTAIDLGITDADRATAPKNPDSSVKLGDPGAKVDATTPLNPDGSVKLNTFSKDVKESVGFQPDELNRIVSLVHYR